MGKATSPGWPDPTNWAKSLFEQLEPLAEQFLATPAVIPDDDESMSGLRLRQAKCVEFLAKLAESLRELPTFVDSKSAALVHELAGAITEVVMGGRPDLLQSYSQGQPGGDGVRRQYVKTHAVLAVRVMVEAHRWNEADARKLVAEKFAAAGAKGRKGGPLAASTLQSWCASANPQANDRLYRDVEYFMADWRTHPDWPGTEAYAIEWIERRAAHPLLSMKYG